MRSPVHKTLKHGEINNILKLNNRLVYYLLIFLTVPSIVTGQFKYGENLPDSIFTILNSKSSTLYVGIDNPVSITMHKNERFEDFVMEVTNGIVFADSQQFITIPVRSGLSRIVLYHIEDDDTMMRGHKFFQVKNVPDPLLRIDTICYGENSKIYKLRLLLSDSLSIFFSSDILNSETWLRVEKYSIGYIFGGFYRSYSFEGNKLTNRAKYIINSISPGKKVVFNITASGEGKVTKELPVYRLELY